MKNISYKALILGTVASFFLAIVSMMIRQILRNIANSLMFGDAGAFSYEDQQALSSHPIIVWFDIVMSLLKVIIPCAVAANIAKNNEMLNSVLMSLLLALYSYFIWLDSFASMAHGMFIVYVIIAVIISIPTAILVKRYNNNAIRLKRSSD